MTPVKRSLLELNAGVFITSGAPLFAKLIDLTPVSIIAWRAVIGVAALALFYRLLGRTLRLERARDYAIFAVIGALMAGHWVTYFQAVQVSTVAVGVVALFTWPVMSALLEPLLEGRAPALRDLGLAALATVGVALVVPKFDLADAGFQGVAWGVLSAFSFTLRNLVQRRWVADYRGTMSMGYQLLFISLLLLPFAQVPETAPASEWALLVLLALVVTAGGHSLFVGSLAHLSVTTVGMVACLTPVYGIIYAAILLGEIPTLSAVIGALLVVVVALVENVSAPARARNQPAEPAGR